MINRITAYTIDNEEMMDIINKILSEDNTRYHLIHMFGNMSEEEIVEVLKIKRHFYKIINKIKPLNEYYILLFAIKFFLIYKARFIKSAERVKVRKKRQIIKDNSRNKTCKEKVYLCLEEIENMRAKNTTWEQIRDYLKHEHYTMFKGEKLHITTLKKAYSFWKKR